MLAALVLLAILLRVWGITWGLPNENRAFTYHPDEGVNLVNGVLEDGRNLRPHLDLKFYNYGSLYFYAWQSAAAANSVYGLVRRSDDGRSAPQRHAAGAVILVGRLLSALFGALTLFPLFAMSRRLGGDLAGLLACGLFAVLPGAVEHAHFATVDSMATFLVAMALAASIRLLDRRLTESPSSPTLLPPREKGADLRPSSSNEKGADTSPSPLSEKGADTSPSPLRRVSRDLAAERTAARVGPWRAEVRVFGDPSRLKLALACGAISGLAGATRYNAILVVVAPVAASLLAGLSFKQRLLLVGAVLLGCAAGFLAGCPGALINPERFWADFAFELNKSREGMGLLFANTGTGWGYHLLVTLPIAATWPAFVAGLLGMVSCGLPMRRVSLPVPMEEGKGGGSGKKLALPLLFFSLVFYFVIGAAEVKFLRYVLPLLPVLAAFAAITLSRWIARTRAAILAALALLAFPALASLQICQRLSAADPRDAALAAIRERLPSGASIAFATTPWYGSPSLLPEFTAPVSGSARRRILLETAGPYLLRLPAENAEWDPSVLRDPEPDCVILHSFETHDALRIGWKPAREFLATLRAGYDEASFGSNPGWLSAASTARHIPNDWMYLDPQVSVFFRKRP